MAKDVVPYRPYKACPPHDTIAAVRRILSSLDLLPEASRFATPYPGLYSVRLSLKPDKGRLAVSGKGRTAEYCLASAYAEFLERVQNGYFTTVPRSVLASVRARRGFYYAPDERYLSEEHLAALPDEVLSDLTAQHGAARQASLHQYSERVRAGGAPGVVGVPFYDTASRDVVALPLNLLLTATSSNGMAAGNTLPEAIFQACCEILERWSGAEVYYNRLTPPTIPLSYLQQFTDEYAIVEAIERGGKYRVTVKDFSAGLRIPALGLIVENVATDTYRLNVGCDTSFRVALSRCLTEIYQGVQDESSFDQLALPIPTEEAEHFTGDDDASLYRRRTVFEWFLRNGSGVFPAALFGTTPSYEFSPDTWCPTTSYEEEVQRLVAFFHATGHDVYVRDVSFLGFPSVMVYVPGVSSLGNKHLSALGAAVSPLMLALDAIEDRALKLKRCSDDDLAAIAEVLEGAPRDSLFADLFSLSLREDSPWYQVSAAFVLTQIRFRLGQFAKARESLQHFLDSREDVYRYRYYEVVAQYLELRAEGLGHDAAAENLSSDPRWGDAGRAVAEEMADSRDVFRYTKLPNCPDCGECELSGDCLTTGTVAALDILYPAMARGRVEQKELAWLG